MIDSYQSLDIASLLTGYRTGAFTPIEVIRLVLSRVDEHPERHVWIKPPALEKLLPYIDALATRNIAETPLYGIPFAIKDNIDLNSHPTTASCPEYAYIPKATAEVVQRLIDAGAIPLGKTNLDQFATGLTGVRSPYGACCNSFDPDYVSGGSSSGSAVAVATGIASFALGTDTAGSGRIPASFNNILGFKPTRGLLSTRGVVPACRSLDCVSVFALTAGDADLVYRSAAGYDPHDAYSRPRTHPRLGRSIGGAFNFGIPRAEQLEFFGDERYARAFTSSVDRLKKLGGTPKEIDFTPFLEAALLLYEGPWVAERYTAIEAFISARPDALHPVTLSIINSATQAKAIDGFKAEYRRKSLERESEAVWKDVEVILTPTAGTHYRIDEIEQDPVALNSRLGYYTNFMNLLDFCAVSVPAGILENNMPFGITLFAPAFRDSDLLKLSERFQSCPEAKLGATGLPLDIATNKVMSVEDDITLVAVCGEHMSGLSLNHQLTSRGGRLVEKNRSAPCYRLYALPPSNQTPTRPGMVRVNHDGASIEIEIWAVPTARFGDFVSQIPAPLGFGKLELVDNRELEGFICETYACDSAKDITELGGWRAYLSVQSA